MPEEIIDLLSDEDDSVLALDNNNEMDVDDSVVEVFSDTEDDILEVYDGPPILPPAPNLPNGQPAIFLAVEPNLMLQEYFFAYHGKPEAWQRPKFIHQVFNGIVRRNVVNGNKPAVSQLRENMRVCLMQRYGKTPEDYPIFGNLPIKLDLEFHMPLPNTFFVNRNRSNPLKIEMRELQQTPVPKRPDLDNMVKFVVDALEGVFYKDDKCVVSTTSVKCLDLRPPHNGSTVIKIRQARPGDMPYASELII